MTSVDLYSYQKVATELNIAVQEITPKAEEAGTNLPQIPLKKGEEYLTDRPENGEGKIVRTQAVTGFRSFSFAGSFSDSYISYNTQILVKELTKELSAWEKAGAEEGLIHISNTKELLEKYQLYLQQKPENRILTSLLQLIFENNSWESLTPNDLRSLRNELTRFSEGEPDWKRLQAFSRQLYRTGISPLKYRNEKAPRKKTD